MYLDSTEHAFEGFSPPSHCPLCKGKLVTRWTPAIQCRRGRGYFAIAVPAHTCSRCRVAVRVCVLPRALFKTRKAARESAVSVVAQRNEKLTKLQARTR